MVSEVRAHYPTFYKTWLHLCGAGCGWVDAEHQAGVRPPRHHEPLQSSSGQITKQEKKILVKGSNGITECITVYTGIMVYSGITGISDWS